MVHNAASFATEVPTHLRLVKFTNPPAMLRYEQADGVHVRHPPRSPARQMQRILDLLALPCVAYVGSERIPSVLDLRCNVPAKRDDARGIERHYRITVVAADVLPVFLMPVPAPLAAEDGIALVPHARDSQGDVLVNPWQQPAQIAADPGIGIQDDYPGRRYNGLRPDAPRVLPSGTLVYRCADSGIASEETVDAVGSILRVLWPVVRYAVADYDVLRKNIAFLLTSRLCLLVTSARHCSTSPVSRSYPSSANSPIQCFGFWQLM